MAEPALLDMDHGAKRAPAAVSAAALRLQPKGQEAAEKKLQLVCQWCRIRPGWKRCL